MESKKVIEKLNDQVSLEQIASQAYLGMAMWSEQNALDGAAIFFYAQSDEERSHMLKIVRYINSIGAEAIVSSVDGASTNYSSLNALVSQGLENEKKVTASIHELSTVALAEGDYQSFNFLQWFIIEQAEEEQKFQTIIDKFDLLGTDGRALYSIDKFMGRMSVPENEEETTS